MMRWPVFGTASLAVLGCAYVLSSNLFYITRYAADTPFTPVQSYLLFAAMVVLVGLYKARSAQSHAVDISVRSRLRRPAALAVA
jgi:hypothetical protein